MLTAGAKEEEIVLHLEDCEVRIVLGLRRRLAARRLEPAHDAGVVFLPVIMVEIGTPEVAVDEQRLLAVGGKGRRKVVANHALALAGLRARDHERFWIRHSRAQLQLTENAAKGLGR